MAEVIQTPLDRFKNLPDYPFEPKFIQHKGMNVHYVDEGEGEIILCLHGEPSWSFLYRKFYPVLAPNYRVVSPDFIGFGKSDKLTKIKDYSYGFHFELMLDFIEQMKLDNITLVVQDWGGLIGLGVLGKIPDKFARVVIMNTALPAGKPAPLAFKAWQAFAKHSPFFPIGGVLEKATEQPMSKEVKAAYDAPFPSEKYKAGARAWPALVPTSPDMGGVTEMLHAKEVLKEWNKPALVMFSDKDPIMRGRDKWFREKIPTAKDQPFIEIKDAGHFLQEDKGEEIAEHIKAFIERTPS